MPVQFLAASSSHRIDCGSTDDVMTENGAVTISAWIYPVTLGGQGFGRIVERSVFGVSGPEFECGLTNGVEFFVTGTTSLNRDSNSNFLTLNKWQHVVATWDGSTTATNIHFYRDGVEASSYLNTTNGSGLANNSAAVLHIGNSSNNVASFNGMISEVAIWNVVLSLEEIKNLASAKVSGIPLQIRPASLKAYYPLDEFPNGATIGSTTGLVRDRSSNARHGTANSSPIAFAEAVVSRP